MQGRIRLLTKRERLPTSCNFPPEMSTIFNVFHVSQLRKCLRVPDEAIEPTNIKLQSDLTYEEKPIRVLEEMERVTQNKVIKFYKVVWNDHSEQDAMWEWEDYLCEVYPAFYENGRSSKSQDEISVRGRACNTLVLSMHLALAFHEHRHHPSIHEHEHMKFHVIHLLFITCYEDNILVYACDHV